MLPSLTLPSAYREASALSGIKKICKHMDVDSTTTSQELSYQDFSDQNYNGWEIDGLDRSPRCGLCGRSMPPGDEVNEVHQNDSVCDDCKFLLIEDFGTPSRNPNRRRLSGRWRPIYGGSNSSENLLSQHFSQIINLARADEPGHEEISDDVSNSHLTPNGSRRWRRIISESDSDVSNSNSYYGESESNFSIGAYNHGESDALSYNTYEDDSDTSVGGRTFFNTRIVQSVDLSDLDSDSDIDPMRAGNVQWDFDDYEQVEDFEVRSHIDDRGSNDSFIRPRRTDPPGPSGQIRWRFRDINREVYRLSIGMEESSESPYIGDPRNYLDSQGFEDFLDRIEEIDSSRLGAPPASTSFVQNMPLIVICDEHQKPDGLSCAICKDLLTTGTEVNRLPCLHLYHPNCILPWLRTRNTCPLCRYELPTDNIDRMVIPEIEHRDDSSSVMTDSSEMDELRVALDDVDLSANISESSTGRGGCLLFAAAPIVSLMGIVFLLWLGNPLAGGRRGQSGQNFLCWPRNDIQASTSFPHNERAKRWWWF